LRVFSVEPKESKVVPIELELTIVVNHRDESFYRLRGKLETTLGVEARYDESKFAKAGKKLFQLEGAREFSTADNKGSMQGILT
jgi:hypothetical protein